MEIKSTEKAQKIPNELETEQIAKNDSNSIDSDIKNKNILASNLHSSEETHFSSENKSTSTEKPDKNNVQKRQIHSCLINNNTKNNNKNSKLKGLKFSTPKKPTKIPHKFNIFLERTEDFQKKKIENMNELQKNYEDNIKKLMKEKPDITQRSRILDKKNSKPKFLDRVKEEQIKQKQRKEKLIEKINAEKAKKKEETDKPLEFNIKPKEDKKFMKVYEAMMTRQKETKERFKIFNEVVKEYHMKECTFAPKINKVQDNYRSESDSSTDNNNLSEKLVKRMYNDEIKYRNKRKDDLVKKYKPSFQPKINDNADRLSRNWKIKLSSKNQTMDYEMKNYGNKITNGEKRLNKSSSKNDINDSDEDNDQNV